MDYKINEKQVNALLQYLAAKPYAEVYSAVEMLQTLDKIEPEEENGTVN